MRSKVTAKPSIEPVTLQEVKDFARVTNSAEDSLINQFIQDARLYCERVTGRKFITQTIEQYDDGLTTINSDEWWTGNRLGSINDLYGERCITMEFLPVQSITQVDTIDQSNAETLYASTNYYLDNYDDDMRSKMVLNTGASFSIDLRPRNNIKLTYVAGYGDNPTDVPSDIRRAIISLSAQMYFNRGDCSGDCAEKCGAMKLLYPYMVDNIRGLR